METQMITSRKNEVIKDAARLAANSDYRRECGLFLVEGARLCSDAAKSAVVIESCFVTEQAEKKYSAYIEDIRNAAVKEYIIEPHVAEVLSATKTSQGIYCVCKMDTLEKSCAGMENSKRYIALETIQDPGNLGAVLRTAEALGVHGVLLCGSCCDVYSPKVLRASMGAVFRLPFYFAENFSNAAESLKKNGFQLYAATPSEKAKQVTQCAFYNGTVIVVGNEGNGLTDETVRSCDEEITIPMLGRAESLNAASSAAILMWEMMRSESIGHR